MHPGFNSLGVPVVGGARYLPIVIQDKIFIGPNLTDAVDPTWPASLSQLRRQPVVRPHLRPQAVQTEHERQEQGPLLPDPSVVPEFFGDTMLANGTVYPEVTVEAGRYRVQFLNACNARFLNLQLYVDNGTPTASP